MFTKEDYRDYFQAIVVKKRTTLFKLQELLSRASDENLINALTPVLREQLQHYVFTREIFETILLGSEREKRVFEREHTLGQVRIKSPNADSFVSAHCVDISKGGIGIECEKELSIGDEIEVWINMYGKNVSLHQFGKLVWYKKVESGLYIGGVQFKA